MKNPLLFVLLLLSVAVKAQTITTVAGNGTYGYFGDGVPATSTSLTSPIGVAADAGGNVYIAERNAFRIRKVSPAGIITTIAGNGLTGFSGDGGPATAATMNRPYGVAVDKYGNVYFADFGNDRVRRIDTSGIITTVAGNGLMSVNTSGIPATAVSLYQPVGIAVDDSGCIYIAESAGECVQKVSATGIITTIACCGSASSPADGGPATAANLHSPYSVAVDKEGNVYVGEDAGSRVRKISPDGIIHRFAGTGTPASGGDNGPASAASLNRCLGIAVDTIGNVYISDGDNNSIRKVDKLGIINTIAGIGTAGFYGDDGPAIDAELSTPVGLAFDKAGNLYASDFYNTRVRRISPASLSADNVNLKSTTTLSIYPNPAEGLFTINIASGKKEQFRVAIYNCIGERVKEFTMETNSPTIVLLGQPNGVYYLSATNEHAKVCNTVTLKS